MYVIIHIRKILIEIQLVCVSLSNQELKSSHNKIMTRIKLHVVPTTWLPPTLNIFDQILTFPSNLNLSIKPNLSNASIGVNPFPIVDLVIQNYNPKCIFTYLQNHISGNTSPPSIPPLTHNTPNQTTNITIKQQ